MHTSSADSRVLKRCVVAITRRDGLFLAIRRGRTVAAGGRVCFPGGHIEPGEEEHQAVDAEGQDVPEAVECAGTAGLGREGKGRGTEGRSSRRRRRWCQQSCPSSLALWWW